MTTKARRRETDHGSEIGRIHHGATDTVGRRSVENSQGGRHVERSCDDARRRRHRSALGRAGIALLSAEQASALTALLGAIPGAVALVGTTIAAFRVRTIAKPDVTPVADPRDDQGNHLVPGTRAA